MTNLEDAVKRLAAYSAMYAEAKVDDIGPKGGIKRVPASNCISILDNGAQRRELLHSDLKVMLGAAEQFDGILVRALTLPVWGDVEDQLADAYKSVEASYYQRLQAVYGRIQDMLALNLVLARAAMAGDDVDEQPPSVTDADAIKAEHDRVEQLLNERIDKVKYGTNWDQDQGYKQGLADAVGIMRHVPRDGEPDGWHL